MNIGITGGCGFVGGHLTRYFLDRGDKVVVLDNLSRRGSEVNLADLTRRGAVFLHGDVRIADDVEQLHGCEVVLECSAQPSAIDGYDRPRLDFEANTAGLFNVLELCRRTKAALILWSTNKVFSGDRINSLPRERVGERYTWPPGWNQPGADPAMGISEEFPIDGGDKSIYGMSKAAADLLCQEYAGAFDLPVIVNRCSCLAGAAQWGKPSQGWVAWLAIAARFGLPVDVFGWNDGCQVRDILFADDLCDLIGAQVDALSSPLPHVVYNVGGGPGQGFSLSLREALALVQAHYGPLSSLTYRATARRSDHALYLTDTRRVRDVFGWSPRTTVWQGYADIFRWVEDNEAVLRGLYDWEKAKAAVA